MEGFEPPTY